MLSDRYKSIKQMRSAGNLAGAIGGLQSSRMENDEDALEAVICCFAVGNAQEAARLRDSGRLNANTWAGMAASALAGMMTRGNPAQIIVLAEGAVNSGQASYDAFAIYLMALQMAGRGPEAYARIQSGLAELPLRESLLALAVADVAQAAGNWHLARHAAGIELAANPESFRALLVASFAASELDHPHEALGLAQRAHRQNRQMPLAVFQVMRCLNNIGDYYGAIGTFRGAGDGAGALPQILEQLGTAYAGVGRRELAVQAFHQALDGNSHSIDAIRALLRLHLEAGERIEADELIKNHQREIEADIDATYVRGLIELDRGHREAALHLLRHSMKLTTGAGAKDFLIWPVSEPHIRHEYEQMRLLQERGKLPPAAAANLPLLQQLYDKSGDPNASFAPEGAEGEALRAALAPFYYVPEVPQEAEALAVQDYAGIEAQYKAGKPQMVVIDNFLSPQALADLRAYCEEATIFKTVYSKGYMGAFLSGGFSPPVLLAIADELRRAMPEVVGPHPLMQAWAFKYDQRRQGINMHADFARINVNFWITPDEACADPTTGGMVIYDVPAPEGWSYREYNSESEKMMAFCVAHDAKPIRVPYRANRCVLFDSTLFHTTDELHFNPGFTNRRINVTLLFGQGLSTD
jgi:tetratricopeptide (TPR) repeat protein